MLILVHWLKLGCSVHDYSMSSLFVGTDTRSAMAESQNLENSFVSFSRLIGINVFVSHLLLVLFISRYEMFWPI